MNSKSRKKNDVHSSAPPAGPAEASPDLAAEEALYHAFALEELGRTGCAEPQAGEAVLGMLDAVGPGRDWRSLPAAGKRHVQACSHCLRLVQDYAFWRSRQGAFAFAQEDFSVEAARAAGAEALPGYLASYSDVSLKPGSDAKPGLFALVLRLTQQGIDIATNGLAPVTIHEHAGMALRGAAEYPSYSIEQTVGQGKISYQVYRENEQELMLSVKLDSSLAAEFPYVKLKKDNRVLTSLSFGSKNIAVFNQLKRGDYLLELMGKQRHSIRMALA